MFTLLLFTGVSIDILSPAFIVLLTSAKSFTFILITNGSLPGLQTIEVAIFCPPGILHQNLS